MRRSLLGMAACGAVALLMASASSADAGLFFGHRGGGDCGQVSYGGGCGGCGGYAECGGKRKKSKKRDRGCCNQVSHCAPMGCGYAAPVAMGCGAPMAYSAPAYAAPAYAAPSCGPACAPAPTCCAPQPVSCAAPYGGGYGGAAGGVMAPPPPPPGEEAGQGQPAPPPPPEEGPEA